MTPTSPRLLAPALLLALTAPAAAQDLRGRIATRAFDAIAVAGGPARVRLKVERVGWHFWRPDVRGAEVRFAALGRRRSATTDADGVATVTFTAPRTPGVHPTLAQPSGRPDAAAAGRLWVLDPARPVAVVDVDGTLSDLPDWRVPLEGHRAPAFPGSPALLRELARTHQVIYLTARDEWFDASTRDFLALHGFPDGPVILNDLGFSSLPELWQLDPRNHGEFKLGALRGLQALGLRVTLGIGNADTDAWAYERAGIASYIRGGPRAGGSTGFADYAALRALLRREGVLGARGLAGALAGRLGPRRTDP